MTRNTSAVLALAGVAALVVTAWPASPAGAQDTGCCQFFTHAAGAGNHGRRQCDEVTQQECAVLRARSTFLAGWQCNPQTQHCTVKPSGPPPTPTATAQIGCCQLDGLRQLAGSVCGNDISDVSCANDFAGTPTFCADCVCSSHPGTGFDLSPGACVPPPTPTPIPAQVRGCCQLDNLRGAPSSICGNAIRQEACLNDFDAQPTFCQNCICSSHSREGFDLTRGVCAAAGNRRPRHAPEPPGGPQHPGG